MDAKCICGATATFGLNGTRIRCKKHALYGMKFVFLQKKCAGCRKQPSFGLESGKPTHCAEHRTSEMSNVRDKRCAECDKQPNYGMELGKPTHCAEHKTSEMTDVKNKRCMECDKRPAFGLEEGKPTHCVTHKKDGMTDVRSKRCAECDKRPTFGLEEGKPTHCVTHKKDGMTDVRSKRCAECDKRPTYGLEWGKATHCNDHKTHEMSDVVNKRCAECSTFRVWKSLPTGFPSLCLGCFDRAYPDHPKIRRRKTKETFFYHKMREALPDVQLRWDKSVPNTCGIKRRPDYYIEGVYRDLAGECDENDHDDYETTCEEARLHDLVVANGYRPLHVFRFNPDGTPKPVRVSQKTGVASEGPGFKALIDKIVTGIREWIVWDATTPVAPNELLLDVTYL